MEFILANSQMFKISKYKKLTLTSIFDVKLNQI